MVASGERRLRMLVIHTKHDGFFVALVPAVLSEEQVEADLHEVGVEPTAVLELSEWRTWGDNVAVARVPGLEEN